MSPSPFLAAGSITSCHLFVVLLQVGQLLGQAFNLHLQVGLGQGQLVQHPAQAIDVGLHALAQGYLIFIPETSMIQILGITYIREVFLGRDCLETK